MLIQVSLLESALVGSSVHQTQFSSQGVIDVKYI
jgi:hypothetical protein